MTEDAFKRWWEREGKTTSGPLTNKQSAKRGFEAGMQVRQEIDVYDLLKHVMLRPAMYFGRPSITAFWHFYHGLSYLGGCGHGGPFMYKLKNDLEQVDGFTDWACKKHEWSGNIDIASHYLDAAKAELREKNFEEPGTRLIEQIGFTIFARDLAEYRDLPPCFSHCKVGYPHDGECIPMEGQ